MILSKETARQTASQLLQIKAIKLQPEEPFTWASGWNSPIYCDNRVILSHPKVRNFIRQEMAKAILNKYGKPQYIAGVATGAIAMGVLIAQEMDIPFVYVRPEPKSHGRKNQIEGQLKNGAEVVVVEDLVSTGGSSLKAAQALREAGAQVLGMAAVFTYGFPLAEQNFEQAQCELVTLCDYNHLLDVVHGDGLLNDATFQTLKEWRQSPDTWQLSV
ncbi:MAG: orotate phosphoribosyltransferase [Owenweeksia sp.]|nr:orotate phosphoribosyltransferase [Owenweeksia sp.]